MKTIMFFEKVHFINERCNAVVQNHLLFPMSYILILATNQYKYTFSFYPLFSPMQFYFSVLLEKWHKSVLVVHNNSIHQELNQPA